MITAIGTPVLLNQIKHIHAEAVGGDIDGSVIKNKVKASLIIERYTGINAMTNATAEFIATSRLTEFVPLLFKAMNETGEDQVFIDRQATLFRYFDFLDKDQAIAILYEQLLSDDLTSAQFKLISKAISSSNLIDYDQVEKLLAGSLLAKKAALKVLTLDKDWYSAQDIAYLQTWRGEGLLQLFPEVVTVKESKGIFSSGKEVWECLCGYSNKLDATACSSCTKDKRGFGTEELKPEAVQKLINRRLAVIEGI